MQAESMSAARAEAVRRALRVIGLGLPAASIAEAWRQLSRDEAWGLDTRCGRRPRGGETPMAACDLLRPFKQADLQGEAGRRSAAVFIRSASCWVRRR